LLLLALFGVQPILLVNSLWRNSPTFNEPGHLTAGLSQCRFARFELFVVNPPLVRIVSALPVAVSGYTLRWPNFYQQPGMRPEFRVGENWIHANGHRTIWLMTLARLACIPFCLLGGWICYLWARDLFGPAAGLFAGALWCFSPMVLGLGSTIAPDAHAAALGLAACYTFWRWLKSPTWTQTFVTGVVLGLAELSKTTFILFYPIWPMIWVVYRWGEGRASGGQVEMGFGSQSKCDGPLIPSPSPPQSRGRREPENKNNWTPSNAPEYREAAQNQSEPTALAAGNDDGCDANSEVAGDAADDLERSQASAYRSGVAREPMTARRWAREGAMLAVRMLIGIYVLNLGYLGEGSFARLGEFRFVSELFGGEDVQLGVGGNRFADSWLGEVPMPFPRNYILGIDIQQRDFEDFGRPSYLRGQWQQTGWWYYYLYAVAVKTPLGTLGLMLISAIVCFTRFAPPIRWYDAMVLLVPPAVIFAVASYKCGFSHHSRYIMPCVPFVFVWLGQFGIWMEHLSRWLPSPRFGEKGWGRREPVRGGAALGVVSGLLLAWTIGSSLYVYPHSLSYFNELAGGPKNGPAHLLNSNVDWGQDLLFLEKWAEQNAGGLPVYTAFYNLYNPFDLEIAGIEPWPFRREDENWESDRTVVAGSIDGETRRSGDRSTHMADGYYAISVNLLYDYPWSVYDRDGGRYHIDRRPHGYLRSIEPVGWAGYSIRIYSAEQMRAAFAAPRSAPLWDGS
jgi:hypothetical protein